MVEQTHADASGPDRPAEVFRSARSRRVKETALVLQAMGIAHQVVQQGAEAAILVDSPDAERALREIELYERENRGWPHPEELPEVLGEGLVGVLSWVGVLLVAYAAERNRAFGLDWWESGKTVAALVREGEVWRAMTSLTLHDDIVHLVGNIVFGAIFVGVVCQVMGPGLRCACARAAIPRSRRWSASSFRASPSTRSATSRAIPNPRAAACTRAATCRSAVEAVMSPLRALASRNGS